MKKKSIPIYGLFFLLLILCSCGNETTSDKKTISNNNRQTTQQQKPLVQLVLDGRVIESADYNCMWILKGKENIFNLTVHYDREPKRIPPNVGFGIYNLKDINLPINLLNGKMAGKLEQQFSLSALLAFPKGQAANMNELSFSDNYAGLNSTVQITVLDTTAKIVSGSFKGTLKNANGKTMVVSNGKFDRIPLQMIYK